MQGVLSVVAGQAMAGSLLKLGSPAVSTAQFCNGNSNGVVGVARKPFAATLDIASSRSVSRLNSVAHSFPLGKRLRRSCVRVSALQQSAKSAKWVLDPCGDGSTSHLDAPVPLPSGFELTSDSVIVGRVKDRVDVVIPIATVSGVHARLEKKNGQLFITDLDSTNGTFINDKRLRPGAVTSVPVGSYITFGDEHLAVFRFLQLEEPEEASAETTAPEESQEQEAQAQ